MGKSVNKVTLIGNLCRDPEVRYMPNGNAVANVSLATDESYNDKTTGQKVEQTEFHRVTVYGKLAEICQQYLKKGSKAYFEGRLKTREWEKDGIKRYTTEIVANDMMMLDGRQSNDGQMNQGGYQAAPGMAGQNYGQQSAYQHQNNGGAQHPINQSTGSQPQYQGGYQQPMPQPSNSFDDFDDDIPF